MESLRKQAARILGEQRKYKIWLTAFLCLALLVTAGTVAALTLSGQALTADEQEKELDCQVAVHRHTEQCYDSEGGLICGQADYVIHTHDESCYGEEGELVCTLPEITAEIHVHASRSSRYSSAARRNPRGMNTVRSATPKSGASLFARPREPSTSTVRSAMRK